MREGWREVALGTVASQRKEPVRLAPDEVYRLMGIRWKNLGAYERGRSDTTEVKAKTMYRMRIGDFAFNRIDTDKGAFSVVGTDMDGSVASNEFPAYRCVPEELIPDYLWLHFQQPEVLASLRPAGSDGRARWKEADFERYVLRLPPLEEQQRIVDLIGALDEAIEAADEAAEKTRSGWLTALDSIYRGFTVPTSIESVSEHVIGGAWGEKPGESELEVSVVGGAAFAGGATSVAADRGSSRSITAKVFASRALRTGDIVLEVSGGSEAQPVGRVMRATADIPSTIPSNFMRLVRIDSDVADIDFVFWVMWLRYQQGVTRGFQRNTTGIRNLSVPSYLAADVMFPSSIAEQKKFAATARAFEVESHCATENLASLRTLRSELLTVLLSGEHEIPESYDVDTTSQLEPAA